MLHDIFWLTLCIEVSTFGWGIGTKPRSVCVCMHQASALMQNISLRFWTKSSSMPMMMNQKVTVCDIQRRSRAAADQNFSYRNVFTQWICDCALRRRSAGGNLDRNYFVCIWPQYCQKEKSMVVWFGCPPIHIVHVAIERLPVLGARGTNVALKRCSRWNERTSGVSGGKCSDARDYGTKIECAENALDICRLR